MAFQFYGILRIEIIRRALIDGYKISHTFFVGLSEWVNERNNKFAWLRYCFHGEVAFHFWHCKTTFADLGLLLFIPFFSRTPISFPQSDLLSERGQNSLQKSTNGQSDWLNRLKRTEEKAFSIRFYNALNFPNSLWNEYVETEKTTL